jgi:hypothetical protein
MKYIYYIDGEKFTTNYPSEIIIYQISSPDESTPAYEKESRFKFWCKKGRIYHRLTGPAVIYTDDRVQFWLSGYYFNNIHSWLKDHPNQDNTFQVEMLLKYS